MVTVLGLSGSAAIAASYGRHLRSGFQSIRSRGSRRRLFETASKCASLTNRASTVRTIAVANQKGGCGKTTVAINLSASLARECRRTLLVDLDPQAHCALGMAVPEEQIDLSILDCLLGQFNSEPIELSRITWQIAPNLDVAPSRSTLTQLEPKLGTQEGADTLLSRLLEENAERYDYCVVDCPPHLGLLMRNGLRAADEIIIPVDTGYFSLYGLTQQLATIEQLGERSEKKATVRVLANQYDVRTKLAREILAELRKRYDKVVYDSVVNFNTKLKESASFGQPITEFAPKSMGARDFQKLAREIMAGEPAGVLTSDLLEHVERLSADADRLLATTAVLVQEPRSGRTAITENGADAAKNKPAASRAAKPKPKPSKPPAAPGAPSSAASRVEKVVSSEHREVNIPTAPHQSAGARGAGDPITTGPPHSMVQIPKPVSPGVEAANNKEIDSKLKTIYGVRQEGDVVVFRSRNAEASEVQLAGDFNDWMPHTTPMRRLSAGDFEARLRLPKGRYRYRLVVDGRWSHDRENPTVETNEYGELNSIIEVNH